MARARARARLGPGLGLGLGLWLGLTLDILQGQGTSNGVLGLPSGLPTNSFYSTSLPIFIDAHNHSLASSMLTISPFSFMSRHGCRNWMFVGNPGR